jgi:hypothetical protein
MRPLMRGRIAHPELSAMAAHGLERKGTGTGSKDIGVIASR